MKKEHALAILILLGLWQVAAMTYQNNVLFPYPWDTLVAFITLLGQGSTWSSIGYTVLRVFEGFFLSLGVALILALLGERHPRLKAFFEPIYVLSKTIPNVSYIIVVLMLLGSEKSVWFICFLVLFPVSYNQIRFALDQEPQELKDVCTLMVQSPIQRLLTYRLPMLRTCLLNTSRLALSLGIKVSVMGEILGQVQKGIGRQMYLCRVNLDTTGLFAWTLIIIGICLAIEAGFITLDPNHKRRD